MIVACGVLGLFLTGLFSLWRTGQNTSNQGFWLQKTINELRNTSKHLSMTLQKSSYPSTIVFPGNIVEQVHDDFKIHFTQGGTLFATQAIDLSGKERPGTYFLTFVESVPEKQGFNPAEQGRVNFNVYSLTKSGVLLYHRFRAEVPFTVPPDYIKKISFSRLFKDGSAPMAEAIELATDVEWVRIELLPSHENKIPIAVDISCAYPRGKTRRLERIVATPNVGVIEGIPGQVR